MGWTSYHASYYKSGKIDRKAEIDNSISDSYKVLKSAMVGSTYYAAVKGPNEDVFAYIVLTSVDMKDYYNFAYKPMSEDMGPYSYDCPKGILDLLTPTDNEEAQQWRSACRARIDAKKERRSPGSLPVGTCIKFFIGDEEVVCYKRYPAYQFKRPWWYIPKSGKYMSVKLIPDNFEIIPAA